MGEVGAAPYLQICEEAMEERTTRPQSSPPALPQVPAQEAPEELLWAPRLVEAGRLFAVAPRTDTDRTHRLQLHLARQAQAEGGDPRMASILEPTEEAAEAQLLVLRLAVVASSLEFARLLECCRSG